MRIFGFWKGEKFWPKKWKKTKNAERLKKSWQNGGKEKKDSKQIFRFRTPAR